MNAPGQPRGGAERNDASLGVRFALLALACVALMVFDHRDSHLTRVRQVLSVAVHPIRVFVDLPFEVWGSASRSLTTRQALLAENERFRREQLNASFRLQRLATLETENARLRGLLDSTAVLGQRVLVAEIIAVDLDPYRQRFNVNRGLANGVFVGQALLDADGVVGQIVDVGPFTAEAVAITDADHALPVSVNRNGLRTVAVGTGDSSRLRLPYLTNSADIGIGDLLVSSGLGGVFPLGYPVARVLEVRLRPGQSFADVIAEPVSALDRDLEVLLVWDAAKEPSAVVGATVLSELQ
ncbi:rod shape-determining protein MreC [Candidatus Rariloculus sp.]|uniref:rod shape-determining protein MreC n=1 Tax=Candidatus Rariloculus sp. TaxID=3101265 RepID=UPI003D0A4A2A